MNLSQKQASELYAAARAWKDQGSRSKWRTEASLTLWDAVADLEKSDTDIPAMLWSSTEPPPMGCDIYVPTEMYIDRGWDDRCGGLARVIDCKWNARYEQHVIVVAEIPNHDYFWENNLRDKQMQLAESYAKDGQRAHPDPDR